MKIKKGQKESLLFLFSVRGEALFLLSDSDIDTNRHQSDDVTSPKLDLAVTMVMSRGTTLPFVTEVH